MTYSHISSMPCVSHDYLTVTFMVMRKSMILRLPLFVIKINIFNSSSVS